MTIPENHRLLGDDEYLEQGDFYYSPIDNKLPTLFFLFLKFSYFNVYNCCNLENFS